MEVVLEEVGDDFLVEDEGLVVVEGGQGAAVVEAEATVGTIKGMFKLKLVH